MRRNRRVKIVATLGPVSNNEKMIRALFEAGTDVFRINMSHATPDMLREAHGIIRKIETEFSRPVGILIDLQGPKLRVGKFESGAMRLTEGDIVSFVRRESVGGLGRVGRFRLLLERAREAVEPVGDPEKEAVGKRSVGAGDADQDPGGVVRLEELAVGDTPESPPRVLSLDPVFDDHS